MGEFLAEVRPNQSKAPPGFEDAPQGGQSAGSTVVPGRFTADLTEPVVLFLIGMRFNRPWKFWKWWRVARAMPKMMAALGDDPELGLIHNQYGWLGRGPLLLQYWKSFDHLERFARDQLQPHLSAWQEFATKVKYEGDVGIWHETYLIEPGTAEVVYGNMPVWGLAAAVGHVEAKGHLSAARDRMRRTTTRTA